VSATPPRLLAAAGGRELHLERPWVMGVLNASPDSFPDGHAAGLEARVERARALLGAGADLIDIGGESAITGAPALAAEEEIARVVPLIERVVGELGALVSVET